MIKNLLLDIGNVLLLIDRERLFRELAAFRNPNGANGGAAREITLPASACRAFEMGEIGPRRFYEQFLESTGCTLSYRHFLLVWTRFFKPNLPMIRLGRELAARMPVYLLSNTDPIHIPSLFDRYPQALFFHDMALSYELGAMKPDREFYSRALEKLDLIPEECLFVDDNAENVVGAEEFGIRTIHYRDFEETRALIAEALGESGIELEAVYRSL